MIAIIDYGVGNLFSLNSSFSFIGAESKVTGDPAEIAKADKIVLPGVGAFSDAMDKLRSGGLDKVIKREAAAGKPILGICLGMQVMFTRSFEYGEHEGLGLIKGDIVPIRPVVPEDYKVPHIGWNALSFPAGREKHPVFKHTQPGEHVYFVHSFYASNCGESVIATTEYSAVLTAAAANGNVIGCQFHPEKSGRTGLGILRAFCEM